MWKNNGGWQRGHISNHLLTTLALRNKENPSQPIVAKNMLSPLYQRNTPSCSHNFQNFVFILQNSCCRCNKYIGSGTGRGVQTTSYLWCWQGRAERPDQVAAGSSSCKWRLNAPVVVACVAPGENVTWLCSERPKKGKIYLSRSTLCIFRVAMFKSS